VLAACTYFHVRGLDEGIYLWSRALYEPGRRPVEPSEDTTDFAVERLVWVHDAEFNGLVDAVNRWSKIVLDRRIFNRVAGLF